MTLNVYRKGEEARIEEQGYSTMWGLNVGTDQLDYVIEALQGVKKEIEIFKNIGEIVLLNSSNLEAVRYNQDTEILSIRFKGGNVYEYSEVPLLEYMELLKAESHGKYFHSHIKDKFEFKKLDIPPNAKSF